ncbi:LOW QUALITY PROTEIN: kinesin-like protein KIN-12F [Pyrus x bretschneideri]|uniref:LOW QUALITY PROTEIN: kinesin-like protein KIN-12F n=1 Tax=Pyrus x bretschneideri TaxID=225117 RepID=UPI002030608A|nr:LOW QUALITY PROTEIN: kinesin-like protein KIN-12F [Pyrus x bretschneideri]
MRTKNSNTNSASESGFLGTISTSSFRKLLPRSMSTKNSKSIFNLRNHNSENTPPLSPNIQINHHADDDSSASPIKPELSDSKSKITEPDGQKQALPVVKSEIDQSDGQGELLPPLDPSVKVVVRIRPTKDGANWGDRTVKKVSPCSLSVGDRTFSFDSVFDSKSGQEDVFQTVGVPVVKNALAGYNTSILSYGQSGSGKTYTLWGPPSAMVEDASPGSCQGIVPRIFQMLFSEIQKEQENSEGKQLNYQFRCSFLEIYNEQIGDLLDPTLRNLEIKDDPKNGFYVENLTEEYVTSYEDVTQILIKGLSSRKVGATSMNSKSSRSHIVCTFIIESWCKESSSKCFGSSKTSRMSFVDLAGLDRNKGDDDTGRQCAREDKYVKKSLSRLGLLVNTLAKAPQSEKSEDVSYKSSCLTHLLRELIGGNSKLTVICAVSPDNKHNGEILRTLRFGERAKSVRNEPVINEITEDDVNDLSDQIRQLKEELIRTKSSGSLVIKNGYFQGRNVRESLNQLRVSLNRSLILPSIDNDSDEEVNMDEHDVRELREQLDELHNSYEHDIGDNSVNRDSAQLGGSCYTDSISEDDFHSSDEKDNEVFEEIDLEFSQNELPPKDNFELAEEISPTTTGSVNRSSVSISLCCRSPVLQDPTLSESPKLGNAQRKSVTFAPGGSVSQNNVSDSSKFKPDVLRQSLNQSENIQSSLRSSKIFPGPTESLAASLQRGLQIIDYHQQNSESRKSAVSFSFEHLALKPVKANSSSQTLPETRPSIDGPSSSFLCASCKRRVYEDDTNEVSDSLKTWTVAADEAGKPNQITEDVVEEAKKEELQNRCKEQAAKIEQLNQLIEQFKSCADNGKEMIPYEEFKDGKKLVRGSSVDIHQPETIKEKCEIQEVQNQFDLGDGNADFDMDEKEALLKEVQMLRAKLQSRTDASPNKSAERLRSSLLSRSIQLRKSSTFRDNSEEELEKERQRWTEMESDWISLTDDLRVDLESIRRRAERVEMELKLEKQKTEELDDVLQRSVLGHARMVEHYVELQDKYNDLVAKYRAIMAGIAEVKRAAAKAGAKGRGSRFSKSLATELSVLRVERERERELLKKENKSLKIQLRDTAEAVHAAGELLVRLREAEHSASVAEENFMNVHQENEKLKKQMEKLKRKHKMEMITMKQYMADSKLPESALQPLYREDSVIPHNTDDDQAWRAEFGAIYQEHY